MNSIVHGYLLPSDYSRQFRICVRDFRRVKEPILSGILGVAIFCRADEYDFRHLSPILSRVLISANIVENNSHQARLAFHTLDVL